MPVVSNAAVVPDAPYLQELLEAAEALRLHEHPYWHTLLHYSDGFFGGTKSLVDDPLFFASPDGKGNPEAELQATLRSFFRGKTENEVSLDAVEDHPPKSPICRFLARYEWLDEQLNIDAERVPNSRCQRFEDAYETISPNSVSLIFPTSFMNSPASMYGHTLLTIQAEAGSALLAYAINYAAVTTETFGPLYIANGLVGNYPGYFSILPYYAKLQEYSDVNDRDIWEYPLNLTEAEMRRLVLHIFEMENIYSDYLFFSENCSYNLLFLLDVARPELNLVDQFGWWVIPLDTIRAVERAGLIDEAVYRPSKSTKIGYLSSLLSAEDRSEAISIAKGTYDPNWTLARGHSRDEKIRICDLASEYLQYLHAKRQIAQVDYIPRFLKTLKVRSQLGASDEWRYTIPPPQARPDKGHLSNRIALAAGWKGNQHAFDLFRFRGAYHDILDSEYGYKRGSQIIFLETTLRYEQESEKIDLGEVNAIDILSLAPRNEFFQPTAWKVRTGLFRRNFKNGRDYLIYGLNTGFGRAYDNRALGRVYGMIETDLHIGGALESFASLGVGVSAGFVQNWTSSWKSHIFARGMSYRAGDDLDQIRIGVGQSFRISTNLNMSIELERTTEYDDTTFQTLISGRAFF